MLTQLSNIVIEVGRLLMEWREQGKFEGVWEAPHKFKAVVDGMAHGALSERLNSISPRLPIISEEDTTSHTSGRPSRYWLIDPLDGTASYAQGYAGFVTQVALMVDGVPVLSAVYAPMYEQLYTAERKCGAFLNGQRIDVSSGPATTLIDNTPKPQDAVLDAYQALHLKQYVECGSIGLKICRVAEGSADLFFKKVVLYNWDVAAPHLVLEEAGGVFTDGHGRSITYRGDYWIPGLVAANTRETHTEYMEWHACYYEVPERSSS